MSSNVGGLDRVIRILAGLALLGVAYFHALTGTAAIVAYVVGAIALVTGVIGFCPAWAMFRINTCAKKQATGGPAAK
jgi:uncharacterized membrane protein HdeD (DUF308 family)